MKEGRCPASTPFVRIPTIHPLNQSNERRGADHGKERQQFDIELAEALEGRLPCRAWASGWVGRASQNEGDGEGIMDGGSEGGSGAVRGDRPTAVQMPSENRSRSPNSAKQTNVRCSAAQIHNKCTKTSASGPLLSFIPRPRERKHSAPRIQFARFTRCTHPFIGRGVMGGRDPHASRSTALNLFPSHRRYFHRLHPLPGLV